MIAILTLTAPGETKYKAVTLPDPARIGAAVNTAAINEAAKLSAMEIESVDYPKQALSVRTPWTWAIMEAGKDLENRSQKLCRPGWYFLHASKGGELWEYEKAREFIWDAAWSRTTAKDETPRIPPMFNECQRGGVVAAVKFGEWVTESDSPWFIGPKAVRILAVVPLPFQAGRGMQGVFAWDHERAF